MVDLLNVEVARTPQAQARGLAGRAALPPKAGMLFVFADFAPHPIRVRDMRFPIKVAWLDRQCRVSEVAVAAPGFDDLHPHSRSLYVLEVNPQVDVREGDVLEFKR